MESSISNKAARKIALELRKLEEFLTDSICRPQTPEARRKWVLSIFLACFCDELRVLPFRTPAFSENENYADVLGAHLRRLSATLSCDLLNQSIPGAGRPESETLFQLVAQINPLTVGLNLEDLIYVCEFYLAPPSLNQDGTFYTPQTIARRIARDAIDSFLASPGKRPFPGVRVLDPACGAGIFLLQAYRYLCERFCSQFPDRAVLLSRCVFGVDKDPLAAELTRLVLTLALLQEEQLELFYEQRLPDLSSNIICANSLLDEADFDLDVKDEQDLSNSLNAISWHAAFPGVFAKKGFDVVIGNPPYGLSRDEQIGKRENEKLKAVYTEFRHGKINKYLAFIAKGYELLNSRGVLSYIVPNAWLGIDGGRAIRELLLSRGALRKVVAFDCPVFAGVSVEAVIFEAHKAGLVDAVSVYHTASVEIIPSQPTFDIPISSCLSRPSSTIPLLWSPLADDALRQIQASSVHLGDPSSGFNPLIALQAYATGKGTPPQKAEDSREKIFHTRSPQDSSALPYLEGADVGRYFVKWPGEYLRYGPWLAEYQPIERFKGPRIVLREIIRPAPYLLSAAFLKDTYLYNRSVLHIIALPQTPETHVLALLAILNSKLASFVIRLNGRKSQRRLFPKIVNADLNDFPLPCDFPRLAQPLFELAQRMLKLTSAAMEESQISLLSNLPGTALMNYPETSELQRDIDTAVYATYGLSPEHIKAIEDIIGG